MAFIEAEGLTKTFTVRKKREKGRLLREKTQVRALDSLSFTIEKGELVGYIGPNGAGKSTTVKLLSGILTPDAGTASVGGLTPWETAGSTCGASAWCSASARSCGGTCPSGTASICCAISTACRKSSTGSA